MPDDYVYGVYIPGNDRANVLVGGDGGDTIEGFGGRDRLFGGKGADTIIGGKGEDIVDGGEGTDLLFGDNGDDTLSGGADADVLIGGRGRDVLTGGSGGDAFTFRAVSDSFHGNVRDLDLITDFNSAEDILAFTDIDANTRLAGNQDFVMLADGARFTAAGQMRVIYKVVGGVEYTIVQGNVNNDREPDFAVALMGHIVFQADDISF